MCRGARVDVDDVTHVPLDLLDRRACERASRAMAGVTHVVYAALQEADDLTAGWRDRALMERNLTMFSNTLEPVLDAAGDTLEHVSLLQGAKAYGLHVGRSTVPAKERAPRDDHDNFYFLQEDRLRELADRRAVVVDDPAPTGRVRAVVRQPDEPRAGHRRVRGALHVRKAGRCRSLADRRRSRRRWTRGSSPAPSPGRRPRPRPAARSST